MEPRPYRDRNDWDKMMALLSEGRRAHNGTFYVHTGDVRWWLFYPNTEAEFGQTIFLWETEERLLAWVLFTPDEGYYDLFLSPELRGTAKADELARWCETTLTKRVQALDGTKLRVMWIDQNDRAVIDPLVSRGFKPGNFDLWHFARRLADLPKPKLPDGCRVEHVKDADDARRRATASHAAFKSKRTFEEYWPRYESFTRSRVYEPKHDLMLVAPDGRCAAFCIYWLDEANKVGLFEPVGTHPDFQRMGMGKALLTVALHQMKAAGMETANVCAKPDNPAAVGLYESVGFQKDCYLSSFEKKL